MANTQRLDRFFEAEITNEANGGISPSTVFSALDSLVQAPDYVLDDWEVTREGLIDLLWELASDRVTMSTELRDLLADSG